MNVVLNGGDPDYVALLPSGFAILPDGRQLRLGNNIINDKISSGSLLTMAFQILVDSVPTAKLSLGSQLQLWTASYPVLSTKLR